MIAAKEIVVKSDALDLAVEDHGGTGPGVLLIHGSGANLRAWDLLVGELRSDFRLVTFDLRSHGHTSSTADQSLSANLGDMDAVCSAVGLDEPIVIGHSWGVPVALAYAVAHEKCPGAILVDGIIGPFLYGGSPTWELLANSWEAAPTTRTPAEVSAFLATDQTQAMGLPPSSHWSDWAPIFERMYRAEPDGSLVEHPTPAEMAAIVQVQLGGFDPFDLYESAHGKLLYVGCSGWDDEGSGALGGAYGNAIRQGMIRRMLKVRPDLEVVWLPSGHAVPLEMPAKLAELVRSFAAQVA